MTIRTNTNPRQMDLQPEMRNLLMRNGLQAHVAFDGGGYRLIVQGHDSPLLVYPITERQMLALTDWGTNTANKKAYNILTSIIGKDFYMPKISSMPAMPTVAWRWGYMATASVSVSTDTWGDWVCPSIPWLDTTRTVGFPPTQSWWAAFLSGAIHRTRTPRRAHEARRTAIGWLRLLLQRRSTGATHCTARCIEELAGGHYTACQPSAQQGTGTSIQGVDCFTSLFSNEKWSECLTSHGLIVDMERRTLTVQSESVNADMVYDLTEEEVKNWLPHPSRNNLWRNGWIC